VYHSDLLEEWLGIWHRSGAGGLPHGLPNLGRSYGPDEQADREARVDQALNGIQARLVQRDKDLDPLAATVAQLACSALDIADHRTEALLRDDFPAIARDLAAGARQLDNSVSTSDILQACRNAWTACGLQGLLGRPARLTPAIFAYSMLYPYSDNYLDSKEISREAKLRFSSRFGLRLAGDLAPAGALENTIWKLISLIESQWPREAYTDVYDCLLAIHAAQERSLQQQRAGGRRDSDILRLTIAKGGASVLADACLAKGSLNEAESRFAFGWGVLLQLGDDLQDLGSDRERKFQTLFSTAAANGPLDGLTTGTLHFASAVMDSMQPLANAAEHLKELLRKNSISLLITAAGEYPEFFSNAYLRQLERYSPLRFAFLKSRKQRVARWLAADTSLIDELLHYSFSWRSYRDRRRAKPPSAHSPAAALPIPPTGPRPWSPAAARR
jgi:hypothetical protein